MSTKIQINSLEALERLIGNDNELEIEIRQSVVENFTKKHLAKLANDDLMRKATTAIINEIQLTFFDTIKGTGGWGSSDRTVFKKEYLDNLRADLIYTAKLELSSIISEAIETNKQKETIEAALENASNYIVNTLTEANLSTRLNRMVDAKLKERLGLK